MKFIFVLIFLISYSASAQLNPADQAVLDQQLAEKAAAAQALIQSQQNEAIKRQQELQQQMQNQQIQNQQGAGNFNQPQGSAQNNQQPQGSAQNNQQPEGAKTNDSLKGEGGSEIKLPTGPVKAGPYTQQPSGSNNSKELEKKIAARQKDPFMLPNHLYMKIKRKLGDIQGEGYIDESVVPQRRWALKRYKLVAIIWNVKKPKAMITDLKGDLHMFYVNDRIGNNEGIISSIGNGEIIVNEKGNETRLVMMK